MRTSYKIPHLIVVFGRVAFRLGVQLRDRAHDHARLDEARSESEGAVFFALDPANFAISVLLLLLDRMQRAIRRIFKNRSRARPASVALLSVKVDLNPLIVLSADPI